jgi:peptidoglycan/LPS O-acetylase OafA/YrhL
VTSAAEPKSASRLRAFFALEPLDNRYPALHGIRVVAIVSVVQLHVSAVFVREHQLPLDATFFTLSTGAFFGMDLFFFLSGFLIGSILLHAIRTTGAQNLKRFYLRRILRTFPPYYLLLTVLALTSPLTANQRGNLWHEFAYLTNYYPVKRDYAVAVWGWSLALEEQFYLTVPLLFAALRRLKAATSKLWLLFALWLIPLALRIYAHYYGAAGNSTWDHQMLYFRTHTRIDPIIAGIFLAVLQDEYSEKIAKILANAQVRLVMGAFACALASVLLEPELFGIENLRLTDVFYWGTVTSVLHLTVVLLLLHGDTQVTRFLGRPIFRAVATVGYGVYLVHIPVLDRLVMPTCKRAIEHGISAAVVWPLGLTATLLFTLIVAYLLHILVEKPALALRSRIAG